MNYSYHIRIITNNMHLSHLINAGSINEAQDHVKRVCSVLDLDWQYIFIEDMKTQKKSFHRRNK